MLDDYEPITESLLDGDFSCETTEEECIHDWKYEGEDKSRGFEFIRSLYICRKCGKQKWFKL